MSHTERRAYRLYRALWSSLDLLYPPTCGGCGRAGYRWCQECQAAATLIQPPYCEICGQLLDRPAVCWNCRIHRPAFTELRSWAVHTGPVRNVLHKLKYQRDMSLGEILARQLVQVLENTGWQVDLVVPVPLGVARLRERGYNQASLVARPLALCCGLAYSAQVIRRVRETQSQVGLSIEQRRENVHGAFLAQPDWVVGQSILVVDDVATSVATLDACAEALLTAGCGAVYGLTVSRAARPGLDAIP
jgi:competence protein ComFC